MLAGVGTAVAISAAWFASRRQENNWLGAIPCRRATRLTLMPGSNPVWGLNTLGGALALTTRSGATDPGTEAELTVGAWQRVSAGSA